MKRDRILPEVEGAVTVKKGKKEETKADAAAAKEERKAAAANAKEERKAAAAAAKAKEERKAAAAKTKEERKAAAAAASMAKEERKAAAPSKAIEGRPKPLDKLKGGIEEFMPGGPYFMKCTICLSSEHLHCSCPYTYSLLDTELKSMVIGPFTAIVCACCDVDADKAHPESASDEIPLRACLRRCDNCGFPSDHWSWDCPKIQRA